MSAVSSRLAWRGGHRARGLARAGASTCCPPRVRPPTRLKSRDGSDSPAPDALIVGWSSGYCNPELAPTDAGLHLLELERRGQAHVHAALDLLRDPQWMQVERGTDLACGVGVKGDRQASPFDAGLVFVGRNERKPHQIEAGVAQLYQPRGRPILGSVELGGRSIPRGARCSRPAGHGYRAAVRATNCPAARRRHRPAAARLPRRSPRSRPALATTSRYSLPAGCDAGHVADQSPDSTKASHGSACAPPLSLVRQPSPR